MKKRVQHRSLLQRWLSNGHLWGWTLFLISVSIFCLFLSACQHTPEVLSEPEKATWIFDADEKIILKAITRVLKDRGFREIRLDPDKNRLETDYVTQGDWRTKVIASVQKMNRKEREVTLSVITEKKTGEGWEPKNLLLKEQYETFFGEIEMQIYREWSRGD